jgi:hypothetical protein
LPSRIRVTWPRLLGTEGYRLGSRQHPPMYPDELRSTIRHVTDGGWVASPLRCRWMAEEPLPRPTARDARALAELIQSEPAASVAARDLAWLCGRDPNCLRFNSSGSRIPVQDLLEQGLGRPTQRTGPEGRRRAQRDCGARTEQSAAHRGLRWRLALSSVHRSQHDQAGGLHFRGQKRCLSWARELIRPPGQHP